ncbi:MAG: triosephosphate isomerase, partial [uncultured bacterium]
MRIPLIIGNWKMNKTISESLELVKALHYGFEYSQSSKFEIVVSPPYTALNKVAEFLKDSFISVGAQDLFWEESGAFTGAISAPMLKDAGAEYVIIGHSERRQLFNETDSTVNKKIKAALKHNLIPVFCVGETLQERESGQVNTVIETQFLGGLIDITPEDMTKLVIAYEPVWAIGTGKTA